MCGKLLQPKKKVKLGSRREVESFGAFQLTSKDQSNTGLIMYLLVKTCISKKTSTNFLSLISYEVWEMLVKIFEVMLPCFYYLTKT